MSTDDGLTVNVLYWDAENAYTGDGRTTEDTQAVILEVAQRVARAAATGGLAVVLPGDAPSRAVLITADGNGEAPNFPPELTTVEQAPSATDRTGIVY